MSEVRAVVHGPEQYEVSIKQPATTNNETSVVTCHEGTITCSWYYTEELSVQRVGVITRKGQVTIPIEVRRSLGLKEGDRVAFLLEGKEIRILPRRGSVAERTAGMFKSSEPPLTAEQLREAAEEAFVEETSERS
jgi:AbrB family looped-hinge helix DNA binding protein